MKNHKAKYLSIFFCNLIDIIATLYLCLTQSFVEVNPVVAILLKEPIIFVIVKLSLISIILLRLWRERNDKRVQFVINIGFYLYGFLALYYLIIVPVTILTK